MTESLVVPAAVLGGCLLLGLVLGGWLLGSEIKDIKAGGPVCDGEGAGGADGEVG